MRWSHAPDPASSEGRDVHSRVVNGFARTWPRSLLGGKERVPRVSGQEADRRDLKGYSIGRTPGKRAVWAQQTVPAR